MPAREFQREQVATHQASGVPANRQFLAQRQGFQLSLSLAWAVSSKGPFLPQMFHYSLDGTFVAAAANVCHLSLLFVDVNQNAQNCALGIACRAVNP